MADQGRDSYASMIAIRRRPPPEQQRLLDALVAIAARFVATPSDTTSPAPGNLGRSHAGLVRGTYAWKGSA